MKINGMQKWIFSIDNKRVYKYPFFNGIEFDSEWLSIRDGEAIINADEQKIFKWDGCTPKYCVMDVVVGTPDGVVSNLTGKPKTFYGSLIHDALYQFAPKDKLTRKQADLIMLYECQKTNFKLAKLYYLFIRLFGGYWWNKNKRR